MKFGRFEQQGRTFYGTVEGDQVSELEGSIFGSYKATSKRHALASLKTLVPCLPPNFYCAGLNYAAHIVVADCDGLVVVPGDLAENILMQALEFAGIEKEAEETIKRGGSLEEIARISARKKVAKVL